MRDATCDRHNHEMWLAADAKVLSSKKNVSKKKSQTTGKRPDFWIRTLLTAGVKNGANFDQETMLHALWSGALCCESVLTDKIKQSRVCARSKTEQINEFYDPENRINWGQWIKI